jgi:two-component system phosphate regulon sensor histidine kinase PhoR
MSPIWLRAVAVCCAISLALAITWGLYGAVYGFAVAAGILLLLWLRDQRIMATLWRWVDSAREGAPPLSHGVWEDLFALLYKQNRDREREQRALSEALASLRRAAQALPDGVVMLNHQKQITWCNDQAEEHFALKLAGDAGQSITNLLRNPDFLEYLASGEWDHPIDLRVRAGSQGSDRTLSIQLVSYGEAQLLLLSRDVTKIERLETVRRDFVANVSHELKTPLTVLAGFLETIREVKLPARQQEHYLSLMSEQAARMQHLVADLLTLSALEATNSPVDDVIDMGALIQRIEDAARELSKGRHEIGFDVEPGLDLLGAESEVASALTNLVTNAIRYTPEGGQIRISWERHADAGLVQAQFVVVDTGLGIPTQHIGRLTERFYRVDRGRSRESGGTGLGLAIVKHVLTRHQARLEISSTIGVGSRFAAVFPAARIQERQVPATRVGRPELHVVSKDAA